MSIKGREVKYSDQKKKKKTPLSLNFDLLSIMSVFFDRCGDYGEVSGINN